MLLHTNVKYTCYNISFQHTRVFLDALLDDVRDVFEGGSVLFHHVVTQGDVVGEVRLVAQNLDGCSELLARLLVPVFL